MTALPKSTRKSARIISQSHKKRRPKACVFLLLFGARELIYGFCQSKKKEQNYHKNGELYASRLCEMILKQIALKLINEPFMNGNI